MGRQLGLGEHGVLGILLGTISGIGGMIGITLGGKLADHYGSRDARAYCTIPAIASIAAVPFTIAALLVGDALIAMAILFVPVVLGSFWFGPVYAVAQGVAPLRMCATSSAILLFVLNLIGLGLGPLGVGLLSDFLGKTMGMGAGEGVRWALIASSFLAIGTFALFWSAKRTVREDMFA